jgi:endonuclease-3
LKNSAKTLIEKYNNIVPLKNDELQKFPGVGRKVANVITGVLLDENEGIAVDTHVMRLSQRLGFSKHSDPENIEKDLMKLFSNSKDWDNLSLLLIEHGRRVCNARKPDCSSCPLFKLCPKIGVN